MPIQRLFWRDDIRNILASVAMAVRGLTARMEPNAARDYIAGYCDALAAVATACGIGPEDVRRALEHTAQR